jgi:hypothetical protein
MIFSGKNQLSKICGILTNNKFFILSMPWNPFQVIHCHLNTVSYETLKKIIG